MLSDVQRKALEVLEGMGLEWHGPLELLQQRVYQFAHVALGTCIGHGDWVAELELAHKAYTEMGII